MQELTAATFANLIKTHSRWFYSRDTRANPPEVSASVVSWVALCNHRTASILAFGR